jgi:Sulfotransferase domain
MAIQPRKLSFIMHNGLRLSKGFPLDKFISGCEYQAQAGDIFVDTYPKCGTTWVQYILWLIQHDGEPLPLEKRLSDEIPFLEEIGKEDVSVLPAPRVIKTHLPYHMVPHHLEAKYIYVARNPFDCVVSFYHHTRGFVAYYDFAEGDFDEYFEYFINGEVDYGDYFDHLLPWYHNHDNKMMIFVLYEEMKSNIKREIIRIAQFLGGEFAAKVQNTKILHRVIDHSRFESMQQDQVRWGVSERPNDMPPFIRKGQVGDWKNHFSGAQVRRLTEKFLSRTSGTGVETLWVDGSIPIHQSPQRPGTD